MITLNNYHWPLLSLDHDTPLKDEDLVRPVFDLKEEEHLIN